MTASTLYVIRSQSCFFVCVFKDTTNRCVRFQGHNKSPVCVFKDTTNRLCAFSRTQQIACVRFQGHNKSPVCVFKDTTNLIKNACVRFQGHNKFDKKCLCVFSKTQQKTTIKIYF